MDSVWVVPLLIPPVLGLAVGGVLAWLLGRRIDPADPPAKPSGLARTAMWFGVSAAVVLVLPGLAGPVFLLLPELGTTTILVLAAGPALLAYAAATAAVVMTVTAIARRDRHWATWVALATAAVPFLMMTIIAIAVLGFGFTF